MERLKQQQQQQSQPGQQQQTQQNNNNNNNNETKQQELPPTTANKDKPKAVSDNGESYNYIHCNADLIILGKNWINL